MLFRSVVVVLLIVGAQPDHHTAAEVYLRAGNLSRALIEQIKAHAPPGRGRVNLTLVNMPGFRVARNIGAFTFSNGLNELARFASPEVATVQLSRIPIRSAPADFANGSAPVTLADLRSQLLEPSRVVLLFEEPSGLRLLTLETLDDLAGR